MASSEARPAAPTALHPDRSTKHLGPTIPTTTTSTDATRPRNHRAAGRSARTVCPQFSRAQATPRAACGSWGSSRRHPRRSARGSRGSVPAGAPASRRARHRSEGRRRRRQGVARAHLLAQAAGGATRGVVRQHGAAAGPAHPPGAAGARGDAARAVRAGNARRSRRSGHSRPNRRRRRRGRGSATGSPSRPRREPAAPPSSSASRCARCSPCSVVTEGLRHRARDQLRGLLPQRAEQPAPRQRGRRGRTQRPRTRQDGARQVSAVRAPRRRCACSSCASISGQHPPDVAGRAARDTLSVDAAAPGNASISPASRSGCRAARQGGRTSPSAAPPCRQPTDDVAAPQGLDDAVAIRLLGELDRLARTHRGAGAAADAVDLRQPQPAAPRRSTEGLGRAHQDAGAAAAVVRAPCRRQCAPRTRGGGSQAGNRASRRASLTVFGPWPSGRTGLGAQRAELLEHGGRVLEVLLLDDRLEQRRRGGGGRRWRCRCGSPSRRASPSGSGGAGGRPTCTRRAARPHSHSPDSDGRQGALDHQVHQVELDPDVVGRVLEVSAFAAGLGVEALDRRGGRPMSSRCPSR
jgi:hypothetical protein